MVLYERPKIHEVGRADPSLLGASALQACSSTYYPYHCDVKRRLSSHASVKHHSKPSGHGTHNLYSRDFAVTSKMPLS